MSDRNNLEARVRAAVARVVAAAPPLSEWQRARLRAILTGRARLPGRIPAPPDERPAHSRTADQAPVDDGQAHGHLDDDHPECGHG